MTSINLSRVDLNLLVTYAVLIEELNVTRAADRLYLTQSALSRSLARLRDLFDDPLFTRHARGLTPTPKTLEIAAQLPSVLDNINALLNARGFDPSTDSSHIGIAMPEQYGQNFFAAIICRLQKEAPNITFSCHPYNADMEPGLASGQIDFAIERHQGENQHVTSEHIGYNNITLIVRKDHPLTKLSKAPSVKQLLEYPFVMGMGPKETIGDLPIMQKLTEVQAKPNILFSTDKLILAFNIIEATDAVLTGPEVVVNSPLIGKSLQAVELPKPLRISSFPVYLLQHQRTVKSPLHTWLKPILIETMTECWQLSEERQTA